MATPAYQPSPPAVAPAPVPVAQPRTRVWTASWIARLALTLIGAAVMIVAAFLDWVGSISAVNLDLHAFWQETFRTQSAFVQTVGAILLLVAMLAIVGLAFRSGWLTRLAGALGIVGAALVLIEVYRASSHPSVGAGPWIYIAGSVIALVGGFLGTRVVTRTRPAAMQVVE